MAPRFYLYVLLSVLLHVLLIACWSMPSVPPTLRVRPPVTVSLQPVAPVLSAQPLPPSAARIKRKSSPSPVPQAAIRVPIPLAAMPTATQTKDVPTLDAIVAPLSQPSPAAEPVPEEDPLWAYRQQVAARIMQYRPRHAYQRGTCTVNFSIAADGSITALMIAVSSGEEALDRAALNAVRRAAPFPVPPTGQNQPPLPFTLPFRFQ